MKPAKALAFSTLFALLAACTHNEPAVRVERIETPVPVPCVPAERVAELEAAEPPRIADQLTGNAAVDLPIVAGSALDLRAYATDLLAVVRGCGVTAP